MIKIWYREDNGQSAVFDSNENMNNWPDYQQLNPLPAITKEQLIRTQRNNLLSGSDSMALVDRITDDWKTYRQALRNVPQQSGFPENITWPVKPI